MSRHESQVEKSRDGYGGDEKRNSTKNIGARVGIFQRNEDYKIEETNSGSEAVVGHGEMKQREDVKVNEERKDGSRVITGDGSTVPRRTGGIGTININGVLTSISELHRYIEKNQPSVLICTETLVEDAKILNKRCKIRGYRWIGPKKRIADRGVHCLVNNQVGVEIVDTSKDQEAFFIRVVIQGKELYIGCGYQSPRLNGIFTYFQKFLQELSVHKAFLLAGDFNARHITWCHKSNKQGNVLIGRLPEWGASVLNPLKVPTCIRANGQSTIDLLITNQPEWFREAVVKGDLNSDHVAVLAEWFIQEGVQVVEKPKYRLDWKNADWDGFRSEIEDGLHWRTLKKLVQMRKENRWSNMVRVELEDIVTSLNHSISRAADKFIPKKEVKSLKSLTPYWWTEKHERLLCDKQLLMEKWSSSKPGVNRRLAYYNMLRINRKVRKHEQMLRTRSWRSFCDSFQDERQLYAVFKRSLGGSSVPAFKDLNGNTCTTGKEKAEGFNNAYSTVGNDSPQLKRFHILVNKNIDNARSSWRDMGWTKVPAIFTSKRLSIYIRLLKERSAPGMDGVSNVLIKHLSDSTVNYLALAFDLLYAAGVCPDFWRLAMLFPINKGKEVVNALHLRPIALTSNMGKLFEKVINDCLMDYVIEKKLVPKEQYGFLRGKSTVNITTKIAQKLRSLSKSKAIAGLFLDVKKAYNAVWHNGLLHKMIGLGIPFANIRWISDWLRARRYVTRVRDVISSSKYHARGVPQGAVLSPLLFLLFFSDIVVETTCDSFLFADDVSLLTPPFTTGKRIVFSNLQRDVHTLSTWGKKWLMDFEASKTKLVIFSRDKNLRRDSYNILMSGTRIQPVPFARCLGVWFDEKYNFKEEARRKLERFKNKVKLIMRIGGPKWGCPPRYLIQLFTQMAVPALAYNPWSLLLAPKAFLNEAISIQRRTLKRILSLPACSGGDVSEVYSKVPPLDLLLQRLCVGLLVRLVSGNDEQGKQVYEDFLYSERVFKDIRAKIATRVTPMGMLVRSAIRMDIPLVPVGKRSWTSVEQQCCNINLPEFPQLRKHYSEENKRRAYDFAVKVVSALPKDEVTLYTDGGIGKDEILYAGVVGWFPDGSKVQFKFQISGMSPSSHTAELYAIKAAVLWAKSQDTKVNIIADSSSAVKAILNPASTCIHARKIHKLLVASPVLSISWVPSHVGLPGNEEVDCLVSDSPSVDCPIIRVPTSIKDYLHSAKRNMRKLWQKRWNISKNSVDLHALMPSIPVSRAHIFGTLSARIMARFRTGYCGVGTFLFRHGLTPSDKCHHCSKAGISTLGTLSHFFSCSTNQPHGDEVFKNFDNILGSETSSLEDVLSIHIFIGLQVRIANSIEHFLELTTEFGFL